MEFVSYIRVSTKNQGKSGLGLEAQTESIRQVVANIGRSIVHQYLEIESGAKNNRPQFELAKAHANKIKATLIVARLDRISRRVSFTAALMESGITLMVADMPHANTFQLHVYASLAEEERRLISVRTKSALAAAKARGVVLGANSATLATLATLNHNTAKVFSDTLEIDLIALRTKGQSFRRIAETLNEKGIPTYAGSRWYAATVQRCSG